MAFLPLIPAFARLPDPARGAIWAVTASAFFAGMMAMIRVVVDEVPPLELVFFRNLFALAFMVPWLTVSGFSAMRTARHGLYFWRSVAALISMLCWFTGIAYLPLNESTALSFTSPLFATVAAVLFLGEVVGVRRWTATVVGFLGAMIILKPGFANLQWTQGAILASAAIAGANAVLIKQLTRTESPNAIVTYMTLYILPFSLIIALYEWVWPSMHTWPALLALGLFATLGHQALTRAFACMDASAVTGLDFVRLPIVALVAWFAFGEAPDLGTWLGAAVIVASTVYIAHREAVVARTKAPVESTAAMAAVAANDPTPVPTPAAVKRRGADD
jgi:drug/metabolite transporter (DMT)-like permease